MHTRRALLGTSLLALPALAACSVTRSGTTTTATLDVARITGYGQTIQAAATALLAAPALVSLLGTTGVATAQQILSGLGQALTDFRTAAGATVAVTLDTSGVRPAVTTLLSDAQQVLALVQAALARNTSALAAEVGNGVATLATAVAALQAGVIAATPSAV